MFRKHWGLGIGLVLLFWTISLAAQTLAWKPGDTLVYEIDTDSRISGGRLPSKAYGSHPGHRGITIGITGLESDGTSLVHVKRGAPSGGGQSLEALYRYEEFDARLSRDGALLVAVDNAPADNEAPKPSSMSQADLARYRDTMVAQAHDPGYQANQAKIDVMQTFEIPNVVALSCAKRTSLAAGDTWHVVSKTVTTEYDVAVVANQSYHSRNTVVLNVKAKMAPNPNVSGDTTATVYYDPQSRLVVGMHSVAVNNITVSGVTTTLTTDFNLK